MGKSVVFVDDEPGILRALGREFHEWAIVNGYELLFAESGKKALEILQSRDDIELVVTDYRMPLMNGSELIQQIVERFPGTGTVMLTGYSDDNVVKAAMIAGENGYVEKPWVMETLLAEMVKAIDSAKAKKL